MEAKCALSQLKLLVSRLIRSVLWYSVKSFPCGFLIHGLCAHPDCSFVARYDSVRPDESMNRKLRDEREEYMMG